MSVIGGAVRTLFLPRWATWRLLFGAALISFSAVFVKLTTVPAAVSAVYRVLIGGVVLVAWLSWRGRMTWPTPRAAWALLAAGAFYAADLAVWHQSIHYIGPGLATLLGNFQVFLMAFAGAVFLNEKLGRNMPVAIVLAMIGLAMIAGFEWTTLPRETRLGIALGLLTAIFYCGTMLSLRRAQIITAHAGTGSNLGVTCLISAALLLAWTTFSGQSLAIPTVADGVWLVVYALVAQVFGWLMITSALGNVPAARVGLLLLMQPALSFVWDVLLFDRGFTSLEASGAALALFAIYLGSRPARSSA